tara:strand:- start:1244 stop:1777 length:534 start_codon:yes stop_codon:yes gene_type:complete
MALVFRKLEHTDEQCFFAAYQEFHDEADNFNFVPQYNKGMNFLSLLQLLDEQERGENLPAGFVPATYLFAFDGGKIVGRVMIRHYLNDFLRRAGGHIGYGVTPSERGKGYGKQLLREALRVARGVGLERVLLTCAEGNAASRAIIIGNGGEFEGMVNEGSSSSGTLLYWLDTSVKKP